MGKIIIILLFPFVCASQITHSVKPTPEYRPAYALEQEDICFSTLCSWVEGVEYVFNTHFSTYTKGAIWIRESRGDLVLDIWVTRFSYAWEMGERQGGQVCEISNLKSIFDVLQQEKTELHLRGESRRGCAQGLQQ